MKKLFTLILAAALLSTAALTGCAQPPSEGEISLRKSCEELAKAVSSNEEVHSGLIESYKELGDAIAGDYIDSDDERENKETQPKSTIENQLCSKNGITITYTGMTESYPGKHLNLRIENHSDIEFTVQVRDCYVNGKSFNPTLSNEVKVGETLNTAMVFDDITLEFYKINSIDKLEFYFTIYNWEHSNRDFDTEIISLKP